MKKDIAVKSPASSGRLCSTPPLAEESTQEMPKTVKIKDQEIKGPIRKDFRNKKHLFDQILEDSHLPEEYVAKLNLRESQTTKNSDQ